MYFDEREKTKNKHPPSNCSNISVLANAKYMSNRYEQTFTQLHSIIANIIIKYDRMKTQSENTYSLEVWKNSDLMNLREISYIH